MSDSDNENSGFMTSLLELPRYVRLLIVIVLALAVTLAIFGVVDDIYLRYFYADATRVLPSLITATAGLTMYMIGWFVMVGTVGETPSVTPALWGYLIIGLLALLMVAVWLTRLIVLGSA